ncbi:hypothetical protein ACFVJ8_24175 [Streptomyces yangpuensis]|uniref:hypothetical protein n=1 Tax=Streptomyces TaxID=1883 RepID=UPI0005694CED|nr:hypothetical protein [Streptomyces sp. NRRL S-378]
MNEPITPTRPDRAATTVSCCGTTPAQPAAEGAPAQSSPCCGTNEDAEAAGACCAPQAKREAVATGAGCC